MFLATQLSITIRDLKGGMKACLLDLIVDFPIFNNITATAYSGNDLEGDLHG